MPNQTGDSPTEFEWPPREEVLASQVLKLGDPLPQASPPPAPDAPSRDLLDEPHVVLRRTLEARADAQARTERQPQRRDSPKHASPSPSLSARRAHLQAWVRARVLPIALAVLAIVVVLQTIYILRARPGAPAPDGLGPIELAAAAGGESPIAPVPPAQRSSAPGKPPVPSATTGPRSESEGRALLVIQSDPPGARVSLDGRSRGVTPVTLTGLTPGKYRLTLERAGVRVQQTVTFENAEAMISVLAPMRPTAPAPVRPTAPPPVKPSGPVSGWLALQSPIVLDVYEEGSLVGTSRSSRILLPAGAHSLQLVNEQLDFREARDVRIEPGEVLQVPLALPQANVLVNAAPWAEVYIDGTHVGQTPIGRLSLPIGTYDVVFRHPELGEKKATAIVKAGVATRVTMDMRR